MLKTLWNIKLINTGNGQEMYNENLSFRSEPVINDIDYSFVGNLAENGRLIKQ